MVVEGGRDWSLAEASRCVHGVLGFGNGCEACARGCREVVCSAPDGGLCDGCASVKSAAIVGALADVSDSADEWASAADARSDAACPVHVVVDGDVLRLHAPRGVLSVQTPDGRFSFTAGDVVVGVVGGAG